MYYGIGSRAPAGGHLPTGDRIALGSPTVVPGGRMQYRSLAKVTGIVIALAGLPAFAPAPSPTASPSRSGGSVRVAPATDSADIVAVIERFHAALASGDSAGALALLAPDAVILESG